jgi:hypothetical protein
MACQHGLPNHFRPRLRLPRPSPAPAAPSKRTSCRSEPATDSHNAPSNRTCYRSEPDSDNDSESPPLGRDIFAPKMQRRIFLDRRLYIL